MAQNKQPNQTTAILYDAPRPVKIGDVFYIIEVGEGKTYNAPCRVCGGTRQLTVNGITFKCPQCDVETKVLNVHSYVVRRYRVYGVSDEVLTDTWKASDCHRVKFKLYKKTDRNYYACTTREIYSDRFLHINPQEPSSYDPSNAIYDNYALAVAHADALTAIEVEKVAKYNEIHGTNHELPAFKRDHDSKSN